MTTSLRYVGRTYPVPDAAMKADGSMVYGTDLSLPGMLYAKLLLSPFAHARVAEVDSARAIAVSGVVGVFWHQNAPSKPYCRYRLVPEQPGCVEDETLFAATARFVGDRVAAVVATSLQAAIEAARLIAVRYDELPAVLSAQAALAPGAIAIHPGGNLVSAFDHETRAATPLPPDAVVTTTSVETQMLHHAALEPHMCLAHFDAARKLTIWSPCQGVYGARTVVADLLGLSYNTVRVIKVPMGGSFGGKQEFILEPLTAFLALQTGRPVKLVLDRDECIGATMVRPAQRSTLRSAVSPDGVLLDLEVDTLLAAGAYASSSPDYTAAMAHKLTRLYRTPRYRHRARVLYTTTPVAGGMRGWGAPDIATCAEIHLDQVAARCHIDPVQLRLRNLVHPGAIDPLGGRSVGDARVRECLELGARAFDWSARAARPAGTARLRRAVGVACGAHKNGQLSDAFAESSTMTLKMNEDGSLDLNASLHEVGAGSAVTMKIIIAEQLGVDPDLISVGEADSALTPFDFGSYGSRVTYVCGANASALAVMMRDRLLQAAADLLQLAPCQLRARSGCIELVDGPGSAMPYAQIVRQTRMRNGGDMIVTNTYRAASNPGAYAVQFAEVEVDVLTGITRVTDFLTVVDIGRAINRGMVEGQCRGAVQAGIGSALCEEVVLDHRGRPAPDGFKNYHLVNAPDMPEVRVLLVEHDGDDGPFGAKSVGEVATVPTAAAIINALNRALGTTITTLPATPERVVVALAARVGVDQESAACC